MVTVEQIDKKIENLENLKKILEEHSELEEYEYSYDKQSSKLEEQIEIVEEYTTFERALEYLTARSHLDCRGYPKGHPHFDEHRVLNVSQLLEIYCEYLQIFGKAIKFGKMPLEPGDVYDIVYHFDVMKHDPTNYIGLVNGKVIIGIGDRKN